MKLNLIYCKNILNQIGLENDLLYEIKEDMKYSKMLHHMNILKIIKILLLWDIIHGNQYQMNINL